MNILIRWIIYQNFGSGLAYLKLFFWSILTSSALLNEVSDIALPFAYNSRAVKSLRVQECEIINISPEEGSCFSTHVANFIPRRANSKYDSYTFFFIISKGI